MWLDAELGDDPLCVGDVFLAVTVAYRMNLELAPVQFSQQVG